MIRHLGGKWKKVKMEQFVKMINFCWMLWPLLTFSNLTLPDLNQNKLKLNLINQTSPHLTSPNFNQPNRAIA